MFVFRGGIPCVILLMMCIQLGVMTSITETESETVRSFDCYNDYATMFCLFTPPSDHQNCSEYILDMYDTDSKSDCKFQAEEGSVHECKCSFKMILVIYNEHNTVLKRGDQQLASMVVDINNTIKPRPPTITSVNKTEIGNIKVIWNKNYKDLSPSIQDDLSSVVIYHKKGDKISTYVNVTSSTSSLEILGKTLEPNTEYVVTVQSYLYWSGLYSDSSDEWSFTTPPSHHNFLSVLIVSLCFTVVIVISLAFICYTRLKTKHWDNIPKCQPHLLTMGPTEPKLLKPQQDILNSVYVDFPVKDPDESKQWSGISLRDTSDGYNQESCGSPTDSSLGYAKTLSENVNIMANVHAALRQALPNLTLPPSMSDNAMTSNKDGNLLSADCALSDMRPTSGSLSYDNKTYAILLPGCQDEMICGSNELQIQPDISCGPICQLREEDVSITCPDPYTPVDLIYSKQSLNLDLGLSSPMQTDLSYQPCNANSWSISQPKKGILTWSSSDSDASVSSTMSPGAESGYESFSEAVRGGSHTPPEITTTGMNSGETQGCGGRLMSFPSVDMDYQACPSPVTQPNILFGGQSKAADPGDLLGRVSKVLRDDPHPLNPHVSIGTVPPDVTANIQPGQELLERDMPHDLPTAPWKSIIVTDSCYHSI